VDISAKEAKRKIQNAIENLTFFTNKTDDIRYCYYCPYVFACGRDK
jgi:hypothetical protein